ncbi:hypothetical protein B0H13DRAFT_1871665 [Mycena leptocephala]|nr:hypothetical protein B0H13DRAFT_1871665 [Mycena leptocephala]
MLYSLFLSFFVAHSLSFSLAGPDTAQSGVSIEFTWTLDDGGPLSFGLMQRSLSGDAPILGIDGVTNSAGARTGTALVIFRTTGQIILSGVDQLSYNPAIQPQQFSPGKQLTITENTSPGGVQPPPPPPPPPPTTAPSMSTTAPISKIGHSTPATFSMITPPTTIATAADSVSTLSSDGNPGSSIFPNTTFAAGLVNSKSKQSITIPSLPGFTDSAVTFLSGEATFISVLGFLTTPPAQPPLSTTAPSSQHATESEPNIHAIIAAVVTLVIMLIIGGLAIFHRQQRSSTASRLRRFKLRINHLPTPEAVDEMNVFSRMGSPLWGPTRDISAGNLVRYSTDSVLSARWGEALSVPVVWDKQPFAGNSGDVTMQEGNGTGPAVNGRIPVTPPPSYDGHSFVKFD